MNTAEMHAMEHLGATFLRNHPVFGSRIIYFGPMGCRTGFYLLLAGDYESTDIVNLMIEMYEFIRDFEGEIPGASAKDCGNYLDMNPSALSGITEKAKKPGNSIFVSLPGIFCQSFKIPLSATAFIAFSIISTGYTSAIRTYPSPRLPNAVPGVTIMPAFSIRSIINFSLL